MFTQFLFPGQPKSNAISEATFVAEREIGAHADLFIEDVGDLPEPQRAKPSHQLRRCLSVIRLRFTATQQVDFHVFTQGLD